MSQSRKKVRSSRPQLSAPAGRRIYRFAAFAALVLLLAAVGFWWGKDHQAGTTAENAPRPATVPDPGFEKLTGRWQRPDGGYILEVRSVDPGGRMSAAYFNPLPVNVAKAEASREGGSVNVFVELRDVNYPGSTYTLSYDAARDVLRGRYFHAAGGQTYDVYFVRRQP
jgi:hypothetical protein